MCGSTSPETDAANDPEIENERPATAPAPVQQSEPSDSRRSTTTTSSIEGADEGNQQEERLDGSRSRGGSHLDDDHDSSAVPEDASSSVHEDVEEDAPAASNSFCKPRRKTTFEEAEDAADDDTENPPGDGSRRSNSHRNSSMYAAMARRRSSMVPVGYRKVLGPLDFNRRLQVVKDRTKKRCALMIEHWWWVLSRRHAQNRHVRRLRHMILLNARASVLQRWWRRLRALHRGQLQDTPSEDTVVLSLATKGEELVEVLTNAKTHIVREERIAVAEARHVSLREVWNDITDGMGRSGGNKSKSRGQMMPRDSRRSNYDSRGSSSSPARSTSRGSNRGQSALSSPALQSAPTRRTLPKLVSIPRLSQKSYQQRMNPEKAQQGRYLTNEHSTYRPNVAVKQPRNKLSSSQQGGAGGLPPTSPSHGYGGPPRASQPPTREGTCSPWSKSASRSGSVTEPSRKVAKADLPPSRASTPAWNEATHVKEPWWWAKPSQMEKFKKLPI